MSTLSLAQAAMLACAVAIDNNIELDADALDAVVNPLTNAEHVVLAQVGEPLTARNARLREARIEAKARARVQIALILAGSTSASTPSATGR